ncbi:MAG: hypothetical protein AB7O79_14935 [Xanthobacteraceae bacterium]
MEYFRQIAYQTVLRACSFATLGIFSFMVGMSFDPKVAFQSGGFLTTVMAFVLILKARGALNKDCRRTEMWLYIEKDDQLPLDYAQWAISPVQYETHLTFAKWTALVSAVMWGLAFLFALGTN